MHARTGSVVLKVYRRRQSKDSPLWPCLSGPFDAVLAGYEERYQPRFGFLRPVIPEVVNKFLDCGDQEYGFARVRCEHCKYEYLLAFSDKGLFRPCPSAADMAAFGVQRIPQPARHGR